MPFDISKLNNLYQPYRYTEYNVCHDTFVSQIWMTILVKYFLIANTTRQMNLIRETETPYVYPVYILFI